MIEKKKSNSYFIFIKTTILTCVWTEETALPTEKSDVLTDSKHISLSPTSIRLEKLYKNRWEDKGFHLKLNDVQRFLPRALICNLQNSVTTSLVQTDHNEKSINNFPWNRRTPYREVFLQRNEMPLKQFNQSVFK